MSSSSVSTESSASSGDGRRRGKPTRRRKARPNPLVAGKPARRAAKSDRHRNAPAQMRRQDSADSSYTIMPLCRKDPADGMPAQLRQLVGDSARPQFRWQNSGDSSYTIKPLDGSATTPLRHSAPDIHSDGPAMAVDFDPPAGHSVGPRAQRRTAGPRADGEGKKPGLLRSLTDGEPKKAELSRRAKAAVGAAKLRQGPNRAQSFPQPLRSSGNKSDLEASARSAKSQSSMLRSSGNKSEMEASARSAKLGMESSSRQTGSRAFSSSDSKLLEDPRNKGVWSIGSRMAASENDLNPEPPARPTERRNKGLRSSSSLVDSVGNRSIGPTDRRNKGLRSSEPQMEYSSGLMGRNKKDLRSGTLKGRPAADEKLELDQRGLAWRKYRSESGRRVQGNPSAEHRNGPPATKEEEQKTEKSLEELAAAWRNARVRQEEERQKHLKRLEKKEKKRRKKKKKKEKKKQRQFERWERAEAERRRLREEEMKDEQRRKLELKHEQEELERKAAALDEERRKLELLREQEELERKVADLKKQQEELEKNREMERKETEERRRKNEEKRAAKEAELTIAKLQKEKEELEKEVEERMAREREEAEAVRKIEEEAETARKLEEERAAREIEERAAELERKKKEFLEKKNAREKQAREWAAMAAAAVGGIRVQSAGDEVGSIRLQSAGDQLEKNDAREKQAKEWAAAAAASIEERAAQLQKERDELEKKHAQETKARQSAAAEAAAAEQAAEQVAANEVRRRLHNEDNETKEKRPKVQDFPYMGDYGESGVYDGEINDQFKPHGKGTMKYDDGEIFAGVWKEGEFIHECDVGTSSDDEESDDDEGDLEDLEMSVGKYSFGKSGFDSKYAPPKRKKRYKLGDIGDESDMITNKKEVLKMLLSFKENDPAFIRRSDGEWTYATLKKREEKDGTEGLRFAVNEKYSSKLYVKKYWKSHIRPLKDKKSKSSSNDLQFQEPSGSQREGRSRERDMDGSDSSSDDSTGSDESTETASSAISDATEHMTFAPVTLNSMKQLDLTKMHAVEKHIKKVKKARKREVSASPMRALFAIGEDEEEEEESEEDTAGRKLI